MATVFNKSHYDSDQGMLTNVWGPALWHVLHTISFNYPKKPTEKQKRDYKRFLLSLEKVLPCRYCRENFKKNTFMMPVYCSCQSKIFTLKMICLTY